VGLSRSGLERLPRRRPRCALQESLVTACLMVGRGAVNFRLSYLTSRMNGAVSRFLQGSGEAGERANFAYWRRASGRPNTVYAVGKAAARGRGPMPQVAGFCAIGGALVSARHHVALPTIFRLRRHLAGTYDGKAENYLREEANAKANKFPS